MLFLFFSLETSLLLRFLNFSLPTKKITLYSSKYSPKASNTLSPQKSSSNHCFIIINQVGYISNTSVMCYIFCNYGVKSFLKQLKEVYLFSFTTTEMLIDVAQKTTSKLLTSVKKRRLGK